MTRFRLGIVVALPPALLGLALMPLAAQPAEVPAAVPQVVPAQPEQRTPEEIRKHQEEHRLRMEETLKKYQDLSRAAFGDFVYPGAEFGPGTFTERDSDAQMVLGISDDLGVVYNFFVDRLPTLAGAVANKVHNSQVVSWSEPAPVIHLERSTALKGSFVSINLPDASMAPRDQFTLVSQKGEETVFIMARRIRPVDRWDFTPDKDEKSKLFKTYVQLIRMKAPQPPARMATKTIAPETPR